MIKVMNYSVPKNNIPFQPGTMWRVCFINLTRSRHLYVVVAKSSRTLCDPMSCSAPGSSAHGVSQARILERIAISFSRGSSPSRDGTGGLLHGRRILYRWATRDTFGFFIQGRKLMLKKLPRSLSCNGCIMIIRALDCHAVPSCQGRQSASRTLSRLEEEKLRLRIAPLSHTALARLKFCAHKGEDDVMAPFPPAINSLSISKFPFPTVWGEGPINRPPASTSGKQENWSLRPASKERDH